MFEGLINSLSKTVDASLPYVYVLIGMVPIAIILFYVAYYFTFNKVVIIKERVGQAFDFDLGARLVKEEKNKEDLKAVMGDLGMNIASSEKRIRAIPTMIRIMRGKVFEKHGSYHIGCFRFLRRPLKLKLFGHRFWNIVGTKKRIEVLQLSPHIYAPLVTVFDQEVYNKAVTDENYIDWVVHDIEEDNKKYQSMTFWDKYGSAIVIMITMGLCIILVAIVFKEMRTFAEAGSSGAKALADACTHEFIQRT